MSDSLRYIFNVGAGTSAAACGEVARMQWIRPHSPSPVGYMLTKGFPSQASTCECCMRPKKAEARSTGRVELGGSTNTDVRECQGNRATPEDGPWPVASKSNTRCKVLDVIAKAAEGCTSPEAF